MLGIGEQIGLSVGILLDTYQIRDLFKRRSRANLARLVHHFTLDNFEYGHLLREAFPFGQSLDFLHALRGASSYPQRAFRREELTRPPSRVHLYEDQSVEPSNCAQTQNTTDPDHILAGGDRLNDSPSPLVGEKHGIDHVQNSIVCLEVRSLKRCVPNLYLGPILPDLDAFAAKHL